MNHLNFFQITMNNHKPVMRQVGFYLSPDGKTHRKTFKNVTKEEAYQVLSDFGKSKNWSLLYIFNYD